MTSSAGVIMVAPGEPVGTSSTADLERIVFGANCEWCKREEPCHCGPDPCRCSCGRCMFDGPLHDDGPRP